MKTSMNHFARLRFAGLMLLVLGCAAMPAIADSTFGVTVDTSALSAVNGPYSVDFQLTAGGGTLKSGDPVVNTISIGNFNVGTFVNRTTTDVASYDSISNVATLSTPTNGDIGSEFIGRFNAGSSLSFDVTLTTPELPADPSAIPDGFAFAILDGSGADVATTADSYALVNLNFDSTSPTVFSHWLTPDPNNPATFSSTTVTAVTQDITVSADPSPLGDSTAAPLPGAAWAGLALLATMATWGFLRNHASRTRRAA